MVKNGKMDAGLLVLGVTGAFGLWSALQTSPTGLFKFIAKDKDEQTEKVARDAMNLALGLIGAMSAGLYLVYNRKGLPASIGTLAAGIGLYIYYDWLLKEGDKIRNGQASRYSPSQPIQPSWLPYPTERVFHPGELQDNIFVSSNGESAPYYNGVQKRNPTGPGYPVFER